MKIRAPFRYWGSKVRMAPWIIDRLPAHEHFIEACAGSGAITAVKPPALADTLNDVDGEIVNFFRVLRNRVDAAELIDMVSFTPYSRLEFMRALESPRFEQLAGSIAENDVEAAYNFFIRMQMAVVPGRTGWSYGVGGASTRKANKAGRWATMPELLRLCAERFERVQVEQLDILDLIKRYDHPTSLFLIDPPYEDETRPNSTGTSSAYTHDQFDHPSMLTAIESGKASFAITHYPSKQYDALPWTSVEDYTSHRNIANSGSGPGRSEAVERLYILDRSGA